MTDERDIVEQLRNVMGNDAFCASLMAILGHDAARLIETQRAEIERLREGLKPFAEVAEQADFRDEYFDDPLLPDDQYESVYRYGIKIGHFRRARALLENAK